MTVEPIDHAHRLAIRHNLEQTCFVEAGAGTGKTTELVQRVVQLLRSGRVEPRELAAITFTEAAAGELRERARLALEAARRDEPESSPDRARLDHAVNHLDEAHISTIHSFAQAILAEHAIAAGLPPRFDVIDELEAGIEFDAAWSVFVGDLLDRDDLHDTLTTAYVLGLDSAKLLQIARALHRNYHRLDHWRPPTAPSFAIDLASITHALDACTAYLPDCTDHSDKLFAHLHDTVEPLVLSLRDLVTNEADQLSALEALIEAPPVRFRNGRNAAWRVDKADVLQACNDAHDVIERQLGVVRRAVLHTVLPIICSFVQSVVAQRLTDGRVEFHDLLVLARNVLRDQPDARAHAAARYRVLLVDEFQDTDPLQAEIAVLLAQAVAIQRGPGDPEPNSATQMQASIDATIESGRLFFVGDPKQSIYRFRHADLFVYRATLDAHAERRLELAENWRSVPGVIDWVNAAFTMLMDADDPHQAPFRPLHAARPPVDHDAPAVAVFGQLHDDASAAEVRAIEAEAVAALAATVRSEQWPVMVGGELRPARFGDIAILLPTRALLPALETALDAAGVPARVESRSLVFATAEVRDLITILRGIDDPTDAIAVVGALRTSYFGVSDRDLVTFTQAGGTFDPRRDPPSDLAADHPVVIGLARLRGWYDTRWWCAAHDTLADVVHQLDVFAVLAVHPRPRDRWRRVRFLLEQARAFVDAGAGDLRAFIEWAERQRDEGATSTEDAVPDPDDDAVRILTVHGAKGLEFPVVMLAGLNTEPRTTYPAVLWTENGPEVRVTGRDVAGVKQAFATEGYDAAHAIEQAAEAAEAVRLLYVAATRARDHLLVSVHRGPRARRSAAERFATLADELQTPTIAPSVSRVDVPTTSTTEAVERAAALVATRTEWVAARANHIARLRHDAVTSPTDIARRLATAEATVTIDGAEPFTDPVDDAIEGPPWRRGRGGTALGRAVHAVLQDASPGAPLDALARAASIAEGLPELAGEVARRAAAALSAPIVHSAFAMRAVRREVPISAPVEGVLIEGIIDLLALDDDRVVLVDYKTDAVASESAKRRAAGRYAPQLAAYACALEMVLGRPVTDAYLVFAAPDAAQEVRIDDLSEHMDRVRMVLDTERH